MMLCIYVYFCIQNRNKSLHEISDGKILSDVDLYYEIIGYFKRKNHLHIARDHDVITIPIGGYNWNDDKYLINHTHDNSELEDVGN